MSENNITPTSSSSTAQVNTQLQNETFKPLDGASCSAGSFDLSLDGLHDCLMDAISTHIKESPEFALKISSLLQEEGLKLHFPVPRFYIP